MLHVGRTEIEEEEGVGGKICISFDGGEMFGLFI
jgi:hypothetical protein